MNINEISPLKTVLILGKGMHLSSNITQIEKNSRPVSDPWETSAREKCADETDPPWAKLYRYRYSLPSPWKRND